ncbi:MAG: glycosyltransferase family 2 protein [bacterium]
MVIAFIVVMGVLVYTWLVYPALVLWLGRKVAAHSAPPTSEQKELPVVAILFSAHNEESVIRQRLENLAALDYPADRIHVFAGIDGGSDRTAEIALGWAQSHSNVHIIISPENHGKTVMLKKLVASQGTVGSLRRQGYGGQGGQWADRNGVAADVPAAEGQLAGEYVRRSTRSRQAEDPPTPRLLRAGVERHLEEHLLVFTDANTMFAPDALRRLVAPLADPAVGGVCGRLVLTEQNPPSKKNGGRRSVGAGAADEATYWSLETRLKVAESALDSCLGANGAIYAIRAGLFPAHFPDNTIIDDFVIGMKVREQGRRLVYEPAAVAVEELPATVEAEWRRRVRIGAGAYQALALCWRCLLPRYGGFAWMFWSHKVLRWFTPHLLVAGGALLGCLVVRWLSQDAEAPPSSSTHQLINLTTVCLLALASAVVITKRGRKGLKLLGYFLAMQAALFVGFLRFCKGNLRGTWKRTER